VPREAAARDAPARSKKAALSIIEQRARVGGGSILRQGVDLTKLLLKLLDSLDAIRVPFSVTLGRHDRQPSSLGTIAIVIDGGQSSNVASFSRKIQIKSVLEILVFANG